MAITDQFLIFLFLESFFPAINDFYMQKSFLPAGNVISFIREHFFVPVHLWVGLKCQGRGEVSSPAYLSNEGGREVVFSS